MDQVENAFMFNLFGQNAGQNALQNASQQVAEWKPEQNVEQNALQNVLPSAEQNAEQNVLQNVLQEAVMELELGWVNEEVMLTQNVVRGENEQSVQLVGDQIGKLLSE